MSAQYEYINIFGKYYCLQQNPVALAWFLYFKNKSLKLLPSFQKLKVSRVIKRFIEHRLQLRDNRSVLVLSIFGNLCLRVHRGYRLFNYGQNTVIRIIDPDVDTAIVTREIEAVRQASEFDFAPRIFRWNIEEGWYEEELLNGYLSYGIPKSDSAALSKMYYQDIAPCIEQMILFQPPIKTTVSARINECLEVWQDARLSEPELDTSRVYQVQQFTESVIKQLYLNPDRQITLVLSHGDFSLRNMLSTRKGLRVIDWESLAHRSVLFDLYNCFFTELYYRRVSTNLVAEINDAISSLQLRIMSKSPELATALTGSAQMYRRLYYIERICTLVDRKLNNELLDVILRSIEVFHRYEEIVTGESWQMPQRS
jgi:thiamine kinase-like enzyme